MTEGSNFKYS